MAVIGNRRKSELGSNLDKMKGLKVTDLLVPGLFILVFVILTFFVYIPSLKESNDMRHELADVRAKQTDLERNLAAIEPLVADKAALNRDLTITENIIPKNLEVSDFSYYVDKIARDAGLEFKEIQQQNDLNRNLNQVESKLQLDTSISSVRGPITYSGTYNEIVSFLDHLQKDSPYIIEVVQLELGLSTNIGEDAEDEDNNSDNEDNDDELADRSVNTDDENWTIELSISGYFISQESEVTNSTIYQPMTPYTDYSDILEIFNYKANILEETGDQSTPDDRDENADEDDEDENESEEGNNN